MKLLTMLLTTLLLGMLTACGGSDLDTLPDTIVNEVDENQRFALTIPEYKDTNSYAFTGVDGDNVELLAEGGKVVFKVETDFENQPSYNFIMTVTNAEEQTKDIDVTVNIIDVPEDLNSLPLVIIEDASENNRFAFTIPEYKDTNSYVFSGVDGDKVKLWPELGEVIFNNAPDFETKAAYDFVMTVTNEVEQTKEINVTINIQDVTNDFIFEVLEGSEGELSLVINHDAQEVFNNYSFKIYKGDNEDAERVIDRSVNVEKEFIVLKNWDDGMSETLRYTITPTTQDGLPSIKVRPNHAVVKIKVIQWGDNAWKSLNDMFSGVCLTGDAYKTLSLSFSETQSAPNLADVTNMKSALSNCDLVENLSYWDVSGVTNMNSLFLVDKLGGFIETNSTFNTDISQWDTSLVESMVNMFNGAEAFDQDISSWNIEKVTECEDFKEGALLLTDAHTPNFQSCDPTVAP